MFTYIPSRQESHAQAPAPDPKVEALRQQASLNPHPQRVSDPLFSSTDFFDRRDLVQVKYEMVRRVRAEGQAIAQSAKAFGLSLEPAGGSPQPTQVLGLGALVRLKS